MTDLAHLKTQARISAKAARKTASQHIDDADIIRHWPFSNFKGAVIAGYWPIKDELDIRPFLHELSRQNHTLSLPAILKNNAPLEFRKWQEGNALAPGPFKTLEPLKTSEILLPDVIFVPLLAYTDKGYRLGYGGGFYDRTLAQLRAQKAIFACGIACSAQKLDNIPIGEYDAPLDGILTETEFRQF